MGLRDVWETLGRKNLPGPLGNWSSAKQVTIKDSRLGVLNVTLSVSCLIYVIVVIVWTDSYKMTEIPDGLPTFWFESGSLYASQTEAKPYCANKDYDYHYSKPES